MIHIRALRNNFLAGVGKTDFYLSEGTFWAKLKKTFGLSTKNFLTGVPKTNF